MRAAVKVSTKATRIFRATCGTEKSAPSPSVAAFGNMDCFVLQPASPSPGQPPGPPTHDTGTDAATKLARLKQQIAGLSGQDLAQQPAVAEKLSRACQALRQHILSPANISELTGRLKRRVVLD
jgi:hypothetical protein